MTPPSPSSEPLSRTRLLAVVVSGLYAWSVTVLPLMLESPQSIALQIAGGAAPLSVIAAPFVPRPRIALHLSMDVFLGLCAICWWLGGDLPRSALSGFGAFGWLAYTLALGSLSTPTEVTLLLPGAERFLPRVPPRRTTTLVLGVLGAASLYLLWLAWRVERPEVAILAHICALGAVLLLLRAGALLSAYIQSSALRLLPSPSLRRAAGSLSILFCLGVGGLAYSLLSR